MADAASAAERHVAEAGGGHARRLVEVAQVDDQRRRMSARQPVELERAELVPLGGDDHASAPSAAS